MIIRIGCRHSRLLALAEEKTEKRHWIPNVAMFLSLKDVKEHNDDENDCQRMILLMMIMKPMEESSSTNIETIDLCKCSRSFFFNALFH